MTVVSGQARVRTALRCCRDFLPTRSRTLLGWRHDGYGGTERVWSQPVWVAPKRGPVRWLWTDSWYKP